MRLGLISSKQPGWETKFCCYEGRLPGKVKGEAAYCGGPLTKGWLPPKLSGAHDPGLALGSETKSG